MKKIIVLIITLFTIISLAQAQYSTARKVIDNEPIPNSTLTWTLYEDGVVVVSGSGIMPDALYTQLPWWDYRPGITKVIVEEGVTAIGKLAFSNYPNLTEIVVPNSVTSIGNSAFDYNDNLKTVSIGNSVKTMGEEVFFKCYKLETINLPQTVESIGISSFEYCSSLTAINVDADNQHFTSIDGVLFNKDVTTLLVYPAGKTGECVFPETVNAIADYGFSTCQGLTSITIPETISEIGNFVFYECDNVTEINLPNTITKIGDSAFRRTRGLRNIALPNSITRTGITIFSTSGIETVTLPVSMTKIEDYSFELCPNLRSVALPNTLTSIGSEVFYECSSLTSFLIDQDEPINILATVFKNTTMANITAYVPAGMEGNYTGIPWSSFREVKGVDMTAMFGIAETVALNATGETKTVEINTEGDTYDLFTTMNLACQLTLPEEAVEWLSATVENGNLKLTAQANDSGAERSTTLTLWLLSERNFHEVTVTQPYEEPIVDAIGEISANAVRMTGGTSVICVENAQGMKISVNDISGRTIYSGVVGGNTVNIPAPQGVYVVKVSEFVEKVWVR